MSSGKPTTPISSPRIPKAVKLNAPSTPPLQTKSKLKRLSNSYLKTPDQHNDSLPFSPSLKRSNSGTFKSPDYRTSNSHNVQSPPNSSNLLKTPRYNDYDSDENSNSKVKMKKTPQYFSPGKKLFSDDHTTTINNKDDLSEISLNLKQKLSSALGKLQLQQQQHQIESNNATKLNFTELSFTSTNESPTKKLKSSLSVDNDKWSPSLSIQKANLNLQTLQHSPVQKSSPTFNSPAKFDNARQTLFQPSSTSHQSRTSNNESLKQSPIITNESENNSNNSHYSNDDERVINMPSPDEESSAHNALLAALSRQRRKSRSSFGSSTSPRRRRSSIIQSLNEPAIVLPHTPVLKNSTSKSEHRSVKLPSLNIALNSRNEKEEGVEEGKKEGNVKEGGKDQQTNTNNNNNSGVNEQDAVLSLMSLSSPQSMKFTHSRNQSYNNNSPTSSSSSSSIINTAKASPQQPYPQYNQNTNLQPILPPISGLIHSVPSNQTSSDFVHDDNDATDIEEELTDDDIK